MTKAPEPTFGHGADETQVSLLGAVTPPSEVKTRPGKGSSGSLAYVDARFAMERFDEAVGPMNWQREMTWDLKGNIICRIGVLCSRGGATEPEWVWKSDVGTESNIESIKGSYSDAFKRAAVNWGVARDLYDEESEARQAVATFPASRPMAASPAPASLGRAAYADEDPDPEWLCPVHGARRVVPAGISKAGRPYPAFATCPERECDIKPQRKKRSQAVRAAEPEFVGLSE